MRKSHNFKMLADVKCCTCGRKLKRNVVDRKTQNIPTRCYRCHCKAEMKRGHVMKVDKKGAEASI